MISIPPLSAMDVTTGPSLIAPLPNLLNAQDPGATSLACMASRFACLISPMDHEDEDDEE